MRVVDAHALGVEAAIASSSSSLRPQAVVETQSEHLWSVRIVLVGCWLGNLWVQCQELAVDLARYQMTVPC